MPAPSAQPAQPDLPTLKALLAENCMLKTGLDQIDEDTPLFGPGGVGLDSLDVLQIAVGVERKFGVPMQDPEVVKKVLTNLGALREWLTQQLAEKSANS